MHSVASVGGDALHSKHAAFLQWRLGHDHGLGAADLAEAFGICEGDALAMLRGERPVPDWTVDASKAALNAWHFSGHVGDIRPHLQREAAARVSPVGA